MRRRVFLQLLGLAGAGTLLKPLPVHIPPDEIYPGTWAKLNSIDISGYLTNLIVRLEPPVDVTSVDDREMRFVPGKLAWADATLLQLPDDVQYKLIESIVHGQKVLLEFGVNRKSYKMECFVRNFRTHADIETMVTHELELWPTGPITKQ